MAVEPKLEEEEEEEEDGAVEEAIGTKIPTASTTSGPSIGASNKELRVPIVETRVKTKKVAVGRVDNALEHEILHLKGKEAEMGRAGNQRF
jgi:hypothetical protein